MQSVNNIYSNIYNDETDNITLIFLRPHNVNFLIQIFYPIYLNKQGKTTKKYFIEKVVYLMEKWVQTIPRGNPFLPVYNINFLNQQFIWDNYEVILGDILRHSTEKYDPGKTTQYQQAMLWDNAGMSYVRNNDLEIIGKQLHPRHVSQKMLVKRNYDWKREEPIEDSTYESRDCQLRSMDMIESGYDNLWPSKFNNNKRNRY